MADKVGPNEEEDEARESFLDQFLRRLDQTSDHEAGVSTATLQPPSSSELYTASLITADVVNPWLNPDLQTAALHNLLYNPGGVSSVASPAYSSPLAEFPWLLQEFDHQSRPGSQLDSRLAGGTTTTDDSSHDSAAQRLYSSYSEPQEQLNILGASSFQSRELSVKDEPGSSHMTKGLIRKDDDPSLSGHGGGPSSSSKSDVAAGPVPRFGRTMSAEELLLVGSNSGLFSDVQAGSQIIGARQINYGRLAAAPTSPLLSDATTAVGAGGSVTTSAGTSNASLSSESTSNADGDEDIEGEKIIKEGETSSGKRKKPEAAAAASGEEGTTPESKKSDPPKSKPRKRGGAKRLREPRYAIKTRTDVDVLDDGFKWRKYGQKAVKNSPHPRNYYRCTTPLCPVRKRVERSNEDAGLVITTYEGTHTHQTPGFHRPSAAGYFGDRPLGMGGGLFQTPLGPGGANLLPLPPGFDLASLQQANALRNIRAGSPSFPTSTQQQQQLRQLGFQQESLFRAQQFLGLQDPAFGGSVKQEPFQFTAQETPNFTPRNISLPRLFQEQPGPSSSRSNISEMQGPSSLRSIISDHPMQQRSGALFTGLPAFPNLTPGVNVVSDRPAASSSGPRAPADTSTLVHHVINRPRHEILVPAVGGSSSRIDQSLETLVSSSSGRPNFDQLAQGTGSDQPQPAGRSISSSQTILGSGSLDPGRTPAATMQQQQHQQQQQQHQHQQQLQHQQQQQRSIRSGPAGGLSSSSENLQGQGSESNIGQQQAEGLLQDMVRPGGPKVSKS